MSTPQDATQFVLDLKNGDATAANKLLPQAYPELKALAHHYMQQERPDHTLQATAIVHEVYIKLVDQAKADWQCKAHFMATAAEMIRRILVDHARKRRALKRGGNLKETTLHESIVGLEVEEPVDVITLNELLTELSALSPRQARVIELRFFGGMTLNDIAYALKIAPRTVGGDLRVAKAWLRKRLSEVD